MGLFKALIIIAIVVFIFNYIKKNKNRLNKNIFIRKLGLTDKYTLHFIIVLIIIFELII
jgi:hypothetical protein